jgi:asparagine synthase (glutamine-hydrolysing)
MCGISGIISLKGKSVDRSLIEEMNISVSHRGPDADGFFLKENFALAHRRLSIIDLSDNGKQPMTYKNLTIVFNGEVYNYLELRQELKAKGFSFSTGSDTEVILASYLCWGKDCVNRFNGMWSFAIYNDETKEVFCSRDRFGVKPFYYLKTSDYFVFGSEIKQLTPFLSDKKVNKTVLFNYLFLATLNIDDNTFFEGVKRLNPSHNLIFNLTNNDFKIEKYYTLKKIDLPNNLTQDEYINRYRSIFNDSIGLRLRSDVKVGTCLSGGLDSSYVASIASQLYQKSSPSRFVAITASSIDKERDESHFAKKVAEKSNLDHRIVAPNTEDFLNVIDEVIGVQEEPFGSPSIVMQYYVMKAAKEQGCTVMLDGQGGDETLLGYERYYVSYLLSLPLLERIKQARLIVQNSKLSLSTLIASYLYFSLPFLKRMLSKKRQSYIKPEFQKYVNWAFIGDKYQASRDLTNLQIHEITKDQLSTLLNYEDRNSMRFGIETRLPFLDYRLVELSISLPTRMKIFNGWTKFVLRKASEESLPNDISWRRNKFGFEAPLATWLNNKDFLRAEISKSDFVRNFIDVSLLNNVNDNLVLWRLYNVAKWSGLLKVEF